MDVSMLVPQVTLMLAPMLPYLLQAGEKVAQEAGKKFGEEAWQEGKALWERLWPRVEARPAAKEAAEDVAAQPMNADRQAALRVQLTKLLSEDEALAQEIARLVQSGKQTRTTIIASGERSVAAQNMNGNIIITGDRNEVEGKS
ncbi:MAG: hypothetical protein WCF84_02125 [Anaerolineae bacterium]